MSFARVDRSTVFPALGGATISPLCPFPIGEIRSIILDEISPLPRFIFLSGYQGIKSSKNGRSNDLSGKSPFTSNTFNIP